MQKYRITEDGKAITEFSCWQEWYMKQDLVSFLKNWKEYYEGQNEARKGKDDYHSIEARLQNDGAITFINMMLREL